MTIADQLEKHKLKYIENYPTSRISSMKCGGVASVIIYPKTVAELVLCIKIAAERFGRYKIIGGCTNTLFSDCGFDGAVISTKALTKKRGDIMAAICKAVDPENIFIEDNMALIATVGRGMVKAKGTAARLFSALGNAGVNIRMIDQGSSELNIIVGVDEHDYITALRAIYNEFVK